MNRPDAKSAKRKITLALLGFLGAFGDSILRAHAKQAAYLGVDFLVRIRALRSPSTERVQDTAIIGLPYLPRQWEVAQVLDFQLGKSSALTRLHRAEIPG